MPNTLAHIGAQGLVTRAGMQNADPKWIYLGCVIPDVPWILQRVMYLTAPGIDPYTLRAYVIVQASLFSSILLCAALALFANRFWETFSILGLNAVLHLLLDACQTKWANGVHFLAPLSWELTNWGWFWPEGLTTYLLTGLGLVYFFWYGRLSLKQGLGFGELNLLRVAGIGGLVIGYFAIPFLLLQGPKEADSHYLKTLNMAQGRTGHYVELDRARYVKTQEGRFLSYYGGTDQVRVEPLKLKPPVTVSVRGIFVSENKIRVIDHHVHPGGVRDYASYLGLGLILAVWIAAWRRDTSSSVAKR